MSGLRHRGHGGHGEEIAVRSGEGLPESRPRKVGQGHQLLSHLRSLSQVG